MGMTSGPLCGSAAFTDWDSTVSSEFTFGDNLIPFWMCLRFFCHVSPRWTINSLVERTRRIQLFHHIWSKTKESDCWMLHCDGHTVHCEWALWNGPRHLSAEECLQVHDLQATVCGAVLGTFTWGSQRVSGLTLCESGRLIQSIGVIVKAQSRRSCCAFLVHLRAFDCLPVLFSVSACTRDMHGRFHIDSSVPSNLKLDHKSLYCPSMQSHRWINRWRPSATEFWKHIIIGFTSRINCAIMACFLLVIWWSYFGGWIRARFSPGCASFHNRNVVRLFVVRAPAVPIFFKRMNTVRFCSNELLQIEYLKACWFIPLLMSAQEKSWIFWRYQDFYRMQPCPMRCLFCDTIDDQRSFNTTDIMTKTPVQKWFETWDGPWVTVDRLCSWQSHN